MAIILTAYPSSLEVTCGEHVIEGSVRANDVEFRFPAGDEAWTGMALVACFETVLGMRTAFLDLETHTCKLPWEVIDRGSAGSHLKIGLYGAKEDDTSIVVRETVWATMPFRILPGPTEDGEPAQEPSPSVQQRILSEVSKVVQRYPGIIQTEQNVNVIYEQTKLLRDEAGAGALSAKNSATAAQTSAQVLKDSATDAAASAAQAEQAKTDAQTAANSAEKSATTAAGHAAAANTSASSAAQNEQAASASATAAKQSETNAKASENAAAASRNSAADSAGSAQTAATAAANSADAAQGYAADSEQAKTDAQTALAGAQTAQAGAETAKAGAESSASDASTSAQNAAKSASGAATSETNAAASAQNAAASEGNAKTSETNAGASASNAKVSESNAKASENAAKTSETKAANSEAAAQAAQKAAEQARDDAQVIVGGNFAEKVYVDQKAATAESNANQYTDQKIAAIPTPDVSGQINTHNTDTTAHADIRKAASDAASAAGAAQSTADEAKAAAAKAQSTADGKEAAGTAASAVSGHNTSDEAHNDIRELISELSTRLNTIANSEDVDLDQLAELVAYIKDNRSLIEQITTNKVNVSDIINNLTTNVANKPLSAAQGVALKALVDAASSAASAAQSAADSKANASHGNHVPTTETANNARFLRNDNTWQNVTPANIGAAPKSHASTGTGYGIGTGSNYGHVKLSDATNSTSAASAGVAATPASVKSAYDLANAAKAAVEALAISVSDDGAGNVTISL